MDEGFDPVFVCEYPWIQASAQHDWHLLIFNTHKAWLHGLDILEALSIFPVLYMDPVALML